MEKLLNVRFAQAVSIGGRMETYIDTSKGYHDMTLVDDFRIRITTLKTGKTVWSSLFNAVSWEVDENRTALQKRARVRKGPAGQEFEDRELPLAEASN